MVNTNKWCPKGCGKSARRTHFMSQHRKPRYPYECERCGGRFAVTTIQNYNKS